MAKAKRAKKMKMSRKILLSTLVITALGTTGLAINKGAGTEIIGALKGEKASYEAKDFVKDIFTQDNAKYIPIIYMDAYEQATKQDVENDFRNRGIGIASISSNTIGTGTQVKTTTGETYTIIIYGDVNGDGKVNVRDVQKIVQHLLYGSTYTLSGASRIAANVENEHTDVIDVRDAQRIVQFILGKYGLIASFPISDIKADFEAPVITLRGDKEVIIEKGKKYVDAGADVTDNLQYLDPQIATRMQVVSNVDTSKVGNYTVTYNVSDLNGNKAETVIRSVKVIEKELPIIELTKYPVEDVNGTALVKYGESYVEPGFKATDRVDGEYSKDQVTIEIKDKDGNIIDKINENLEGEYTITYKVTNSQGHTGESIRKVKVIDCIEEVISIDTAGLKTNYVEGDKIDLSGIKAIVRTTSGNIKTVSEDGSFKFEFTSDITNITYDGGRIVTITGKVVDPYNGEFEGTGSYTISVKKKISSVQTVGSYVEAQGEIYKETYVARIQSGTDEEDIIYTDAKKNINITIAGVGSDLGKPAKAYAKPVEGEPRKSRYIL